VTARPDIQSTDGVLFVLKRMARSLTSPEEHEPIVLSMAL